MVLGLSMDHQSALRPISHQPRPRRGAGAEYDTSLPIASTSSTSGSADGHTASLVPGDPVLEVDDKRVSVTTNEYQGHRRMTLTGARRGPRSSATGEEKRDPLQKLAACATSQMSVVADSASFVAF